MRNIPETCKAIWQAYKMYAETARVQRSGFVLTGVADTPIYPDEVTAAFKARGESGLEHQAKVAWLTATFASNFPFYFGIDRQPANFWSLVTVALCHDVGETVIGDIPDDGRPEHDAKDADELEAFRALAMAFGPYDHCACAAMFEHFQKRDSISGKALYALDKLDAVLTLIFLESYGCYGSIFAKPSPTDLDRYFMTVTGTDNVADCWAAHFCMQIRDFPKIITKPVLTLLETAFRDVRGEIPAWWGKDIPPFNNHSHQNSPA